MYFVLHGGIDKVLVFNTGVRYAAATAMPRIVVDILKSHTRF